MKQFIDNSKGIYDARVLGRPRMLLLGFQHLFAMFGATVLVPVLTGLSVSATLLFAGLGTLLFHFITKRKVPAFLGSSFAFLGGYATVTALGADNGMTQSVALTYACIGVFCAGLLYLVLAGLIKWFGTKRVLRFFPSVVTGPIIIAIGLTLSGSALTNCVSSDHSWPIAVVAVVVVIVCSIWAKGIIRIVPILMGVIVSYLFALIIGEVDFTSVKEAAWVGLPFKWENTALSVFSHPDWGFIVTAIISIIPIALATMVEHIGDICSISSTTGKNYLEDPGLHRTLVGDGLATALAAAFGAPANTTYGENTGVLNLTKVYDPRVIRIAAFVAVLLAFCPKFAELIHVMPAGTIGGISLILYGMIAAVGVRNLVENQVDFTKSKNVMVVALILVLAIGIKYALNDQIRLGSIGLSGLAVAALVGIILNAVLPDEKIFPFEKEMKEKDLPGK
ncbi:MAG: uracil-xanthine permease family protein [Candidatus Limimorpha sp.]|mgnify:CR=1 FL=1